MTSAYNRAWKAIFALAAAGKIGKPEDWFHANIERGMTWMDVAKIAEKQLEENHG